MLRGECIKAERWWPHNAKTQAQKAQTVHKKVVEIHHAKLFLALGVQLSALYDLFDIKRDLRLLHFDKRLEILLAVGCIGYELEYDGVNFITTGVLTRNGLSPAEALPCLIDMWREGYVTGAYKETWGGEDVIVLEAHITERITQRTWFDEESLLPIRSEIAQDGVCVITCGFENVIVE